MVICEFFKIVAVRHLGFNDQFLMADRVKTAMQNFVAIELWHFAAVTFRDFVTLIFDLLTLDSGHT